MPALVGGRMTKAGVAGALKTVKNGACTKMNATSSTVTVVAATYLRIVVQIATTPGMKALNRNLTRGQIGGTTATIT